MKEARKWENPYIELLQTKESYIINGSNRELFPGEDIRLADTCSKFENICCEIGSGSGKHLVELARRNPDTLCIGFELRYKRTYKTAEKAEALGLKNLLIVRSTALLIPELFTSHSLSGVFINFPDPWSKRRWQKNRTINADFLGKLRNVVSTNGFFSYKTDHREYFDASVSLIESLDFLSLKELSYDLHSSEYLEQNIETEFEGLFLSQKLPIHYLKATFT